VNFRFVGLETSHFDIVRFAKVLCSYT